MPNPLKLMMGTAGTGAGLTGGLFIWGKNNAGQLGDGTVVHRKVPTQVGSATNWAYFAMTLSGDTAAINTDGKLYTWGQNGAGTLGLGDVVSRSSPVQVGSLTNWYKVSGGNDQFHFIKTDGTLWMCGSASDGKGGTGDQILRSSPVQIGSLTNWADVSNGEKHSLLLKTDGTLWTFGANNHGSLGLGDKINRSSPVQVGSATDWAIVSAGWTHSFAIKTDGSLFAWGQNHSGHLGDGSTTYRSSPVQISGNWIAIRGGRNHSSGVKDGNILFTWGLGTSGRSGRGDTVTRTSPVQIGSLTTWADGASLMVAETHQHWLKTDGTLWATGYNSFSYGRLGNNSTVAVSSPVQVGSDTDWVKIGIKASAHNGGMGIRTT